MWILRQAPRPPLSEHVGKERATPWEKAQTHLLALKGRTISGTPSTPLQGYAGGPASPQGVALIFAHIFAAREAGDPAVAQSLPWATAQTPPFGG